MTLRSDLGSFSWNESQFGLLRDLIHVQTGIYFDVRQAELLAGKLAPLLAERRMDSFLDYYYLLKYDQQNEVEWGRVASALAVNETFFWREFDQIKAAVEHIIPQLRQMRPDHPIRIWHAACASGEEPYTMVMALLENGSFEQGPIEILGTDFNADALAAAERGEYRERSFRALPAELRKRYFEPVSEKSVRIDPDIQSRVQLVQLNLVDTAAMSQWQDFDIVFCRNAFIYFSKQSIARVVQAFHRALRPPGYLFVASAESLLRVTTQFALEEVGGAFVYQKR